MQITYIGIRTVENNIFCWLTLKEAVNFINENNKIKISEADIYRNALTRKISLSIYFQSFFILRRVKKFKNKPILCTISDNIINRLCVLEKKCFLNGRNFTVKTEGIYINPENMILDTPLLGYEFFLIQNLLANELKIPSPLKKTNYGITVNIKEDVYQIVTKRTWRERLNEQIKKLPKREHKKYLPLKKPSSLDCHNYFPVYDLPPDACFVIKFEEVEKIVSYQSIKEQLQPPLPRISTPLSRMFWLSCKHNEKIGSLISQPYKLLSIFEQWALVEGITDRLSGSFAAIIGPYR